MGLFGTLKAAMHRPRRAEAERAYLEEATSCADLELRDREIARGRFRRGR